ncbi:hypothetical protein CDAR_291831 [Caerostris darwini]|uniref:LAGLIDADG homing endonuclease n=1 Tax=Caerostris darwini TaxID=1538125 RepID=A0AAV4NWL9_9ARAC|nr:hypothetical protein CDAR_291831 [Caerostris darwini]
MIKLFRGSELKLCASEHMIEFTGWGRCSFRFHKQKTDWKLGKEMRDLIENFDLHTSTHQISHLNWEVPLEIALKTFPLRVYQTIFLIYDKQHLPLSVES